MSEWQGLQYYIFGCALVLYGTLGFGWILLYRTWMKNFHRKPLAGVRQRMMLVGWIVLVIFLFFYTLWAIRIFIPF